LFRESFEQFIISEGLSFEKSSPLEYRFKDFDISIRLVPVINFLQPSRDDNSTIFLYEDIWWRENETIKKRILAHLGRFRSIFARKCKVLRIDTPVAGAFFEQYHAYGNARSKYRFGLFNGNELVAAASFSSGRPMRRDDKILKSFEWVRYASLPDTRISGGMGRLLNAFSEYVHPDEVMSYADLEWSSGDVYKTLGFMESGIRVPVEFAVDPTTWQRFSISKTHTDKAFINKDLSSMPHITNLGSIKFLKRLD